MQVVIRESMAVTPVIDVHRVKSSEDPAFSFSKTYFIASLGFTEQDNTSFVNNFSIVENQCWRAMIRPG